MYFLIGIGNLTSFISMKVKDIWQSGVDRISDNMAQTSNGTSRTNFYTRRPMTRRTDTNAESTIVFVLPLAGRFQTLQRFLKNYEEVCLQHPETMTELLIVLFKNSDDTTLPSVIDKIDYLRIKYTKAILNLITIDGNFSRGIALNRATHSHHIQSDDIIFFIDVDITFKQSSIERIRMNTIRHRQVYFPIVFGQYNPNVWQRQTTASNEASHEFGEEHQNSNLDRATGYFRQFGYGICAIYKADILHPDINGFEEISGWGLEDVRFLERVVKLQQMPLLTVLKNQNANDTNNTPLMLSIFRAPDPTLVHVYHDISCDKSLSEAQYSMCLGTKASTLGSFRHIEGIFMSNQSMVDFSRKIS